MKVSFLLIALSTLCSTLLFSEEKLESYISENKKEQFKYDYEKNEAQSSKLRDSWIAPLNLNYSYTKSNPYENKQIQQGAAIQMDQPIFKSGGIYYGIKFAEASKVYSDYFSDVAKRKLVKDAISLLIQIKQMEQKISKQNLMIKNSEINLAQKKESYLNGQLDSGFLDNAIIERNIVIQALYDIQTSKERAISKFNAISDMKYEDAPIPELKLINQDEFLENNIVLNMSKSEINRNKYNKNVTLSKYLPQINFVAGYNWKESQNQQFIPGAESISNETDYYNYGVKASLPLDINSFRDVESSKIDYLKSVLVIEDKKREQKAIFEQVMQNIENFEKKKQLSVENRDIYEKLLADTVDLYKAGYKTEYDVELLQNSVEIQKIDVEVFGMDKQLELLTLYEMYKNEI
ncbi:MAG: transporter [Sulfurimonas sp. RIFCSPHIGHO2_12_FULL_36_9]|uniref:TolC family protein n=1 Tax=Sulfurimonas sp. RIFCSPLOWO2_12_36_12 TaxID=1802253 RepID=UPI0008BD1846|nr:TolC family protein [Sulfurimonas sp. RIFCSPLOWO2_12_36_12]OHD98179.1 MAG: transporter [Sulfurimonas sp. RIFCSPHIGHO2_12_FULL_36_9]OHD99950.1 MAG: transporter [Sulfurimonas sp. RIFCSPLOWO2_02_FULL_36_28]OHE00347.1 MAG: transporter [Sulfurimonas sp. RIFCSPLOWO2_12_36_12]